MRHVASRKDLPLTKDKSRIEVGCVSKVISWLKINWKINKWVFWKYSFNNEICVRPRGKVERSTVRLYTTKLNTCQLIPISALLLLHIPIDSFVRGAVPQFCGDHSIYIHNNFVQYYNQWAVEYIDVKKRAFTFYKNERSLRKLFMYLYVFLEPFFKIFTVNYVLIIKSNAALERYFDSESLSVVSWSSFVNNLRSL